MIIFAIDPGPVKSGFVRFDGRQILSHGIEANDQLLNDLQSSRHTDVLVLEAMQFYRSFSAGMEVFDAVFWSGRFAQAWQPRPFERILRTHIRKHFGAITGGDSAVRAALIERFGPYREQAIGTKQNPGPLYGLKGDEWSALAIAVAWWDREVVAKARLA